MRVLDSRRLRGANLQTREPAAVAEVTLDQGESTKAALDAWRRHVRRMAGALGWSSHADGVVARPFPGGVAFALPAPVDVLLDATEVNEWAIERASAELRGNGGGEDDFEAARARFEEQIAAHGNPALLVLREEARRRDIPFLWDDDHVTLGMARRSRTFEISALPAPGDVDWTGLGRIPVALVTGTNGKTTTTRLVARMVELDGRVPGNTSTDGIVVDGHVVQEGDWTGAEAARVVLRDPRVDVAILETARGGILRRGLAVDACDAALVTNVASDHFGEFGVYDLATMARAKAVVGTVVRSWGRVVLNGDDPQLVALIPSFEARVVLFSMASDAPAGHEALVVRDGAFVRVTPAGATTLARVDESPLTFGGAARHNVANCLAAAGLAWALGISDQAVSSALRTFGRDAEDNPGRGQVVELRSGVRVLLDFGHNPAGMRDLFALARSLVRAGGAILCVHTQPGDRTDVDMTALAREIAAASPRFVALWESEEYRRGREPGEIAATLGRALVAAGVSHDAMGVAEGEVAAVARALSVARRGDVVVVAPHIEREAVRASLGSV
jgi:cyanophycin synthetase